MPPPAVALDSPEPESAPSPAPPPSPLGRATTIALGAVLAIGAAARLAPWRHVFTPDGVRLMGDGDAYYHALRAERLARAWPHVPWFDPGMNHPYGAEIPWPPLFDLVIAGVARLTGPVTSDRVATVAALVAPVLSVGVILLACVLARLLGGRRDAEGAEWRGLDAALLVALLPSAVRHGLVGRADHHVSEILLATAAFVAYAAALKGTRGARGWPWLVGLSLALAFWNWPGSALYPAVLASHLAAWHLLAPPGEPSVGRAARTLAGGAAIGAALLATSIAAWGPPGALTSGGLTPLTGLSVALCAATAAFAGAIALVRARDAAASWPRRAAHVTAAGLVPLALVVGLLPSVRAGVWRGLTELGAPNAWFSWIIEFWPVVFSGQAPWWIEARDLLVMQGLTPLLFPAAAFLVVRAWRLCPEDRPALSFLAVWATFFVVLAAARRRFDVYAVLPLAVCAAWCVRVSIRRLEARPWGSRRVLAGLQLAALLAVAAPGLPMIASAASDTDGSPAVLPLLAWLRETPAPAAGREAVLSGWSEGHHVQWFARKPVVSTPFGTEIDGRSLADAAAFFLARDDESALAVLQRREVGFLLLKHPIHEVAALGAFAPVPQTLVIRDASYTSRVRYHIHRDFLRLVVSRLYLFDGNEPDGAGRAVRSVRLLAESAESHIALGVGLRVPQVKLFGTVPGAVLEVAGATPGSPVAVSTDVITNTGRPFRWRTRAVADEGGRARVEVPYATGRNGQVFADAYLVASGEGWRAVTVSEADVLGAGTVRVELAGATASR